MSIKFKIYSYLTAIVGEVEPFFETERSHVNVKLRAKRLLQPSHTQIKLNGYLCCNWGNWWPKVSRSFRLTAAAATWESYRAPQNSISALSIGYWYQSLTLDSSLASDWRRIGCLLVHPCMYVYTCVPCSLSDVLQRCVRGLCRNELQGQ